VIKHAPLVTAIVAATVFIAVSARAQSADSVLQKMRDTYGAMKSYSDTGHIVNEYGATDRHTFSTYFNRSPRRFLLDFRKQGGDQFVIWADQDAFHTWWKTTTQQTDYPNPNNAPAISMSGRNTTSAALKAPALLYSKVDLGGDFNNFADITLDGTENIAGHDCYRLVGRASDRYAATDKEVNVRKMTVWVDTSSSLLRQVREEWKAAGGGVNRITTTYQPQANPTIDDGKFRFIPPTQ